MSFLFNFFKPKNRCGGRAGFTLVELLVVVSIISMLSSIVLSSIGEARKKAQIVKVKQEMANVGKALELYRLDHGDYPTTGSDPTIGLDELISTSLSGYMGGLPSALPSWLVLNSSSAALSGIKYMLNPRTDSDSIVRTCGSDGNFGGKYFIVLCSGHTNTYAGDNFDKLLSPNATQLPCGGGGYYCTHQPAN